MRLQNLEIKSEEIEADDKSEDDVREVLDNINQRRRALPLKKTQLAEADKGAKVLKLIVDEIFSVISHMLPQIADLDMQLTQLERSNKSQFVALKNQRDTLVNETNRIFMEMERIREALALIILPPVDENENEMVITTRNNDGNTTVVIDQLLSVNYLFNDSQTSALYYSTIKNVEDIFRLQIALEQTFDEIEQLVKEDYAEISTTLQDIDEPKSS
jgi:regulator of replication initiation timing